MFKFRATVWFLDARAESNADMIRMIITRDAPSVGAFKDNITDEYVTFRNVDNQVWFGPVSKVS